MPTTIYHICYVTEQLQHIILTCVFCFTGMGDLTFAGVHGRWCTWDGGCCLTGLFRVGAVETPYWEDTGYIECGQGVEEM